MAANSVRQNYIQKLEVHGIDLEIVEASVHSTDRGSNLKLALDRFQRIDDPSHICNSLATHITDPYGARTIPNDSDFAIPEDVKNCVKTIGNLIGKVRSIVYAIK